MNSGTGLNILQKAMPDRYFDVGIAEQQAILFAAGLALEGAKPVCAIYSTFLQRAFDQIVHDVCLQSLNVVFAMDRAGLVGDDGPTHHGVFDIAYLRCLPNMVLMAPRDEAMLVHMLRTALLTTTARSALRYPRGEGVGVELPSRPHAIEIGTGEILREGERRSRSSATAAASARRWRPPTCSPRGLDVTVADARFAKPLDAAAAGPARRRARAAGDRRGGRAGGRLRLRRLGVAVRRPAVRASCASGCPTATSRTASRRCCTRRSASPASGSPSASRPRSATLPAHRAAASVLAGEVRSWALRWGRRGGREAGTDASSPTSSPRVQTTPRRASSSRGGDQAGQRARGHRPGGRRPAGAGRRRVHRWIHRLPSGRRAPCGDARWTRAGRRA